MAYRAGNFVIVEGNALGSQTFVRCKGIFIDGASWYQQNLEKGRLNIPHTMVLTETIRNFCVSFSFSTPYRRFGYHLYWDIMLKEIFVCSGCIWAR